MATRNAGGAILNALAEPLPELFGGAADLTSSTKTIFKPGFSFHEDPAGRNVFFGVREFGMCAAVNGMAAHGGLLPFGSTFFCFSDYCKPAIRLASLMQTHSLFIFTHDSIGLGEDGPTHQPIEHLMMLRAVPGLTDFRPADGNETAAAWRLALERKSPCFFALTRQDLPVIDPAAHNAYTAVSFRTSTTHRWCSSAPAPRFGRSSMPRSCSPPMAFVPGWSVSPVGKSSRSNRRNTKRACSRQAFPDWPLKPAQPWDGGNMWASTAT